MSEPTPETLTGGCLCGGVRFALTEPIAGAGYCHCSHCQRRTGTGSSLNVRVPRTGFVLLSGSDLLRSYTAQVGIPKVFCARCGSGIFSGSLDEGDFVGVRIGVLDSDPGVRPQWRQYVDSAARWDEIPDDGLPRYGGPRPPGT